MVVKVFNESDTLGEGITVYFSESIKVSNIQSFLLDSIEHINEQIDDSDLYLDIEFESFKSSDKNELNTFLSMVSPSLQDFEIQVNSPVRILRLNDTWDIEMFLIEAQDTFQFIYWETSA